MLLGAHVSITGGVQNAPQRAREVTCDCMQIFSKNQMQWKSRPLGATDASQFRENMEKFDIRETVVHDSYLINLASPDKALLTKSREAFLDEALRADQLGVRYLIFHPGAHVGSGEQAGLKTVAESLNWVRKELDSSPVEFIIEITAGQGSVLGHSFEQLSKIIDALDDQKHAGICFDTCHAYAAGYDVKTRSGYERTFTHLDEVLGVDLVKAMHLNDSKGKLGSHLDRHDSIGSGFLGIECFKHLMNDDRWESVPMVLETPQAEKNYANELKTLRSLIEK